MRRSEGDKVVLASAERELRKLDIAVTALIIGVIAALAIEFQGDQVAAVRVRKGDGLQEFHQMVARLSLGADPTLSPCAEGPTSLT